jgi:hypothetical protein
LQRWSFNERYWSARWSIPADKKERQPPPSDDLGDGGNAGTGDVDIENGEIKKSRLCQNLRVSDIASLGNNAMPKRFDHFGEHHPDEDFIFDQEYACLAEHFKGARQPVPGIGER